MKSIGAMRKLRITLVLMELFGFFIFCPAFGASLSQDVKFEQRIGNQLPMNAWFFDEYGKGNLLSAYFGEVPVILVFSYFKCPSLCTLVLNGLVEALKSTPDVLGKDYQILSVTLDPSEKPPLALAKERTYLAKLGFSKEQSWHFLTGEQSQIRSVTASAGFHYFKDPQSGEFSHPSGIVVLTPRGLISQYLLGIQFDPKSLHRALFNAAREKKGTWVQEVLLYCFHYDPQNSRNGPVIMKVIRLAGSLGVVGVAVFLSFLFFGRPQGTPI